MNTEVAGPVRAARGVAPAVRPRVLRIGVDARAAAEDGGGRGRVVDELLGALARRDEPHRYRLYTRARRSEGELDERFAWRPVRGGEPAWQVRAARAAAGECDVFLALNTYVMAALLPVPTVPMVHDVLPPRRHLGRPLASWVAEAAALAAIARRAPGFVAVSHSTAAALARRHPSTRDRVTVAPLGVSRALEDPRGTLPAAAGRDFILAVGSEQPRKNLGALAAAYAGLPPELRRAHPLVVAGTDGTGALRALGDDCRVLGRVSDAQLGALYRSCAVFCCPSLTEGFGLPVAEAMAAGAPVVASPRGSLPELAGDAAVYVDPESPGSIAAGLERVLRDPALRDRLSRRGRARAASLDWDRTASLVLGVLERAARLRRAR